MVTPQRVVLHQNDAPPDDQAGVSSGDPLHRFGPLWGADQGPERFERPVHGCRALPIATSALASSLAVGERPPSRSRRSASSANAELRNASAQLPAVRRVSLVGASAATRSNELAASMTRVRTASQCAAEELSPPEVGSSPSTR